MLYLAALAAYFILGIVLLFTTSVSYLQFSLAQQQAKHQNKPRSRIFVKWHSCGQNDSNCASYCTIWKNAVISPLVSRTRYTMCTRSSSPVQVCVEEQEKRKHVSSINLLLCYTRKIELTDISFYIVDNRGVDSDRAAVHSHGHTLVPDSTIICTSMHTQRFCVLTCPSASIP